MAIVKYEFKPGVNKENTNYSNEFGWFDSNLVRFKKGLPEKSVAGQNILQSLS